ncbi:MAG: glycosyl transferase, partial [Anaerolineae bacterium]|nr:glycosyl transferase [Anaerolineae bacterium]
YKRGYRARIVDSTTLEEANSQVNNWIRQRSRWVKGYIQTWLVHMRHPVRLYKELGFKAFFSFQMLIGGTFFALLMNPIYWFMTTIWYLFRWDVIQSLYPSVIFYVGAICLYIGNFIFTYANIAGAVRHKYYDMVRSALFSPIYWGLMSIGAWKGFIQLLIKPHFWEKTHHGLDKTQLPVAKK